MNRFDIFQPCARLKPYVKHLAISESDEAQQYNVLPDTSLVMGFQFSGRLSYLADNEEQSLAAAGITGLMNSFRTFKNTSLTGSVLVVFQETGAAHFINQPINELFAESLSLDHFFTHSQIEEVQEQLFETQTDRQRLDIVERFLLDNLSDRQQDMLVAKALQYIHQSKGAVRISELARALYISQSPLEKRFRRFTGASPKKFAAIVRARNVIAALDKGDINLSEYLSSYYDQAHFIKDFKKFTSTTPEQYLKAIRRSENGK